MAYAPAVLIVSAGKEANSHAWMVQGVRRLLFDPVGACLIPLPPPEPVVVIPLLISVENLWGGACMQVTHYNGGSCA